MMSEENHTLHMSSDILATRCHKTKSNIEIIIQTKQLSIRMCLDRGNNSEAFITDGVKASSPQWWHVIVD